MLNHLTVVMYHYVRDLGDSRFPKVRGLSVARFRNQIAYMQRFYTFVSVNDCIKAIYGDYEMPLNAALLTFDDGYCDHYRYVFPILDAMGIQGVFFPPVRAVRDGCVLDVNKIHFILASMTNHEQLKLDIFSALNRLRSEGHPIIPNEELYLELAIKNEWDAPEVIFVKRLLQRELSQNLRSKIVDELFNRYVTTNESAFARELYVSEEQLCTMVRHGMIIGSHGYEHRWMNTLSSTEQRCEVEISLDFLQSIGTPRDNWLMSYPYGAYDDSLRSICSELECKMAFTTEVEIADLNIANALILPRLDTNHLPTERNAISNIWTQRVI